MCQQGHNFDQSNETQGVAAPRRAHNPARRGSRRCSTSSTSAACLRARAALSMAPPAVSTVACASYTSASSACANTQCGSSASACRNRSNHRIKTASHTHLLHKVLVPGIRRQRSHTVFDNPVCLRHGRVRSHAANVCPHSLVVGSTQQVHACKRKLSSYHIGGQAPLDFPEQAKHPLVPGAVVAHIRRDGRRRKGELFLPELAGTHHMLPVGPHVVVFGIVCQYQCAKHQLLVNKHVVMACAWQSDQLVGTVETQ